MPNNTSSFLKPLLAALSAAAFVFISGPTPVRAHDRMDTRASAATHASAAAHAPAPRAQRYAAPASPVRYAAPVHAVRYAAPVHAVRYAAPVHAVRYAAPVHAVRYAAPVHAVRYAAPVHAVRYAAPVHAVRYAAPVHAVRYAAPVRVRQVAPAMRAAAPFMERVAPRARAMPRNAAVAAPFMQYLRAPHRAQQQLRAAVVARQIETSPLARAVYGSRRRAFGVAYRPRYIAGRVVAVRRGVIVVDPPIGQRVVVREVVVGFAPPIPTVGTIVTLPVTYVNGAYQMYAPPVYSTPTYANYEYVAPPSYGYAYAPPMYCDNSSSTTLYATVLPALISVLSGNGGLSANDLASAALGSAMAPNCVTYAPTTAVPYVVQPYSPTPTLYTPVAVPAYTSPYDTCLYADQDGDQNCAAPDVVNTYQTGTLYGAYTPQQVQGVVLARTGDTLMVLGAGGTPVFVDAAPAMQSGYTVNGPIGVGQIIDAYGFYNGNTFVATTVM